MSCPRTASPDRDEVAFHLLGRIVRGTTTTVRVECPWWTPADERWTREIALPNAKVAFGSAVAIGALMARKQIRRALTQVWRGSRPALTGRR
jgi:hypothetical protein